jgi:hypothetical protein
MTYALPPEHSTSEQRDQRVAELQHRIAREWLRFAITEALVVWAPLGVFLVAYVTEAVGETPLVPVTVAAGALAALLTTYWLLKRIRPLQAEIGSIENYESTLAGAR